MRTTGLDSHIVLHSRQLAAYPHERMSKGVREFFQSAFKASNVRERRSKFGELRAAFRWLQVKEKLGGLRCYYDGGPLHVDILDGDGEAISLQLDPADDLARSDALERLYAIVDPIVATAVERCSRTCELCRQPGVLRRRLYMGTLCDLHARPGWRLPESFR